VKTVLALSLFSALFLNAAYAEISTDGTTGTLAAHTLTPTVIGGKSFEIPQSLGTTAGNNLFHSFQSFNINTGESATFTGSNTIQNVISRVTGGHYSTINGSLISTVGQTGFYFINPAGVLFGPNATIDVPAAFHVSTADSLRFTDGSQLDTTGSSNSSLSIAEPASFGFLNNSPANIEIYGSHLNLVKGNTFDVVAGNIVISNNQNSNEQPPLISYSEIRAEAGLIRLWVAANGLIIIEAASKLDVSGDGGGQLEIQCDDISINDSQLLADNKGYQDASLEKGITISANTLSVDNNSRIAFDALSSGNAGNITINSGIVDVVNGSQVSASTFNAGNAGNVNVIANTLTIANGNAGIFSTSEQGGTGNAGNITINSGTVDVVNGSQISTGTLTDNAKGNAGNIHITTDALTIDNSKIICNYSPQ
jgi:filamentous hemagglutinin family protein